MSVTAQRLRVIRLVAGRELRSTLYGIGIYIVMALSFVASSYFLNQALWTISQNGVLVVPPPLVGPLFIAVLISSVYLALLSSLSISRERDQGTLEVLFYGPVDSISYVLGKFVEQMLVFGAVLIVDLVFFLILSLVTNLGLNWELLALLVISFFVAASVVAFGIFLSSVTKSSRASVVLFVALMVALIGFSYGYQYLMNLPDKDLSTGLIYLRQAADILSRGINWLSPVGYLNRGATAVALQSPTGYLVAVGEALVYALVLLAGSVFFFNRKGVKRG